MLISKEFLKSAISAADSRGSVRANIASLHCCLWFSTVKILKQLGAGKVGLLCQISIYIIIPAPSLATLCKLSKNSGRLTGFWNRKFDGPMDN